MTSGPIDSRNLFSVLSQTWPPAEAIEVGSWTLRRGLGGGNRVSAATLDGPTDEIAIAEAAMRAWSQVPLFQIRDGDEGLDAELGARGYQRRDPTEFLVADIGGIDAPGELTVIPCAAPLACQREIWRAAGIGVDRLAVMHRATWPKAWLLGRLQDRPVAAAFVAVSNGVAMMHALEVSTEARRRGVGAQVTRGAAMFGSRHGASSLAVAVTEENVAAQMLYAGLGFSSSGGYHYRRADPKDTDAPHGMAR